MDCLPPIVPTTGSFGKMETAHGPVPMTARVVDHQAAHYGFGCRELGDAKITSGTGAFAFMGTGDEIINKPPNWAHCPLPPGNLKGRMPSTALKAMYSWLAPRLTG